MAGRGWGGGGGSGGGFYVREEGRLTTFGVAEEEDRDGRRVCHQFVIAKRRCLHGAEIGGGGPSAILVQILERRCASGPRVLPPLTIFRRPATPWMVTLGMLVVARGRRAIQAVATQYLLRGPHRCYRRNRQPHQVEMAEQPTDYSKWSNEKLIDRVTQLERRLAEQTAKYVSLPQFDCP